MKGLILFLMLFAFTACTSDTPLRTAKNICTGTDVEGVCVQPAPNPPEIQARPQTVTMPEAQVFGLGSPIVFQQKKRADLKEIEVVLVMDTSNSLDHERPKIAEQFDSLFNNLPEGVDVHLALMLAHTPDDSRMPNTSGYPVKIGDEYVLKIKAKDFKNPEAVDAFRQKLKTTLVAIGSNQKYRGRSFARHGRGSLGEAGLFTLYRALTNHANTVLQRTESNKNANRDFWRQLDFLQGNRALLVMFLTDEQDICFDYSNRTDLTPAYEAGKSTNELGMDDEEFKAYNKYCHGVGPDGNEQLTPELVYNALVANQQKDKPLIISGIMFTDPNSIEDARQKSESVEPGSGDAYEQYVEQNELGHGYLDLICINQKDKFGSRSCEDSLDLSIDIYSNSYAKALQLIAQGASDLMVFNNVFGINNSQVDDFDVNNMKAVVFDPGVYKPEQAEELLAEARVYDEGQDYETNLAQGIVVPAEFLSFRSSDDEEVRAKYPDFDKDMAVVFDWPFIQEVSKRGSIIVLYPQ